MSSRLPRATSLAFLPALVAVLALSACGGGSSPPPVSITENTDTGNGARHFAASQSGSADPSLQWDFGDGTTATGASVDHTYAKAGDFTVTVRASDGAATSATASVRFADRLTGHTCTPAAPWCWQGETALPGVARPAVFVDALHGWLYGEQGAGELAATTDGGMTWTAQQASTYQQLYSIRFADASLGYATSGQGLVLRTTDGGATWTTLATHVPVADSDLGITARVASATASRVVMDDGFASLDGGATWTPLPLTEVTDVPFDTDCWDFTSTSVLRLAGCAGTTAQDVTPPGWVPAWPWAPVRAFSSAQRALVMLSPDSGTSTPLPVIGWETLDAGGTWQSFAPLGLVGVQLTRLVMASGTDGWASTNLGGIVRTQDAGRTWTTVPLPAEVVAQADWQTAFDRLPDGALWVARGQLVARTADNGANWQVLTLPTVKSPLVAGVYSWSTDGQRVAATIDRRGFSTTDGGATWTQTFGATPAWDYGDAIAAVAIDAHHAVVVSNLGPQRRTTDGLAWTQSALPGAATTDPVSLAFPTPTVGWMMRGRHLWTTTDAAATWTEAPTPGPLAALVAVGFPDATHGWVLDATGLFRSTDGGAHWQSVVLPAGSHHWIAAAFPSATGVVMVDDIGNVQASTDGGATWKAGGGVLASVLKVTADGTLWSYGTGSLARSADGGTTWTVVRPDLINVRDVAFVDAQHGWIVDSDGIVATTSDGGTTWVDGVLGEWVLAPTAIAMSDPWTGWVATSSGDLLATATGGH